MQDYGVWGAAEVYMTSQEEEQEGKGASGSCRTLQARFLNNETQLNTRTTVDPGRAEAFTGQGREATGVPYKHSRVRAGACK